VGGRLVGDGEPCFIVAEACENSNGNVDIACAQIQQAALSGADAVKFQTNTREELYNPSHPRYAHRLLVEMPLSDYPRLVETAAANNVILFSTPFDEISADFLGDLGVPCFKVGSGELTHHALLRHIARKGKPVIISTGAAEQEWIDAAVRVVKEAGNDQIILTHCVSVYPAPVELANVRAVPALRGRLNVLVGFSDHTMGTSAPMAAVALGACLVEKHFTLSRALPEGDNDMSVEPHEFRAMVQGIREVEAALGTGRRSVLPEEEPLLGIFRRGIYARTDIRRGQRIEAALIAVRRPLSEIPADQIDGVVGRTAKSDIPAGEALRWEQLAV
jgi:sialic acid synthase SpsE